MTGVSSAFAAASRAAKQFARVTGEAGRKVVNDIDRAFATVSYWLRMVEFFELAMVSIAFVSHAVAIWLIPATTILIIAFVVFEVAGRRVLETIAAVEATAGLLEHQPLVQEIRQGLEKALHEARSFLGYVCVMNLALAAIPISRDRLLAMFFVLICATALLLPSWRNELGLVAAILILFFFLNGRGGVSEIANRYIGPNYFTSEWPDAPNAKGYDSNRRCTSQITPIAFRQGEGNYRYYKPVVGCGAPLTLYGSGWHVQTWHPERTTDWISASCPDGRILFPPRRPSQIDPGTFSCRNYPGESVERDTILIQGNVELGLIPPPQIP